MISFILGLVSIFCAGFILGSIIYKTYFVKLLSAFAFVFLFCKFSFSFQFIIFALLIFLLIYVSVIDYFYKIIPVIFPTFLIVFGIFSSFVNSILGGIWLLRFINSFLGAIMGGGVLFIVRISGWLIYKKETMGLGDVKLMVAVGTFIGCEKVLLALFIAVLFGSITGLVFIIFKKIKKNGYIPFGPFLSVASFIVLFIPKLSSFFNVPFIWEKCIL